MTARTLNTVTVLGLLGLLVTTAATAPYWARLLRREVADEGIAPAPTPPPPSAPEAQATIRVSLHFAGADRPGLVAEEREVPFSPDLSRQVQIVVAALLADGRGTGLPPGTQVLQAFVTPAGIAYVDLSGEARGIAPLPPEHDPAAPSPGPGPTPAPDVLPPGRSSQAEIMAVYSIVDSLTVSFPAIRRVQILVDGQPVETLWGHLDLSRPLGPDLSLLADSVATPGYVPPAAPAASPSPGPP